MSAVRSKPMNYLTVNAENYLDPSGQVRKRMSRSVSPTRRCSVSFDDGSVPGSVPGLLPTDLRRTLSTKSLYMLAGGYASSDSSPNSSLKLHKSTENLCFGMARKKLHRRAHINEQLFRTRSNTDPDAKVVAKKHWKMPIINIPETGKYTVTPATPAPTSRRSSTLDGTGALSSLIGQTLKVTTASVGLKTASVDGLTQLSSKPLNEDVKFSRSTSSVSALAYDTSNDSSSMAPLQSHAEAQSVTALNSTGALETDASASTQQQQLQQHKNRPYSQQLSVSGASTYSGYSSVNSSFNESYHNLATLGNNQKNEARSLKTQSSSSLNPLATVASSASLRSISPSRKSLSSTGSNTAKHEQQSTAAATAAAAAGNATTAPDKEKEKKRKEVSSSRVKKFHRHFSQVSKDEKLINYFSCALVSDILLQGHLYITDKHFAFYSNVFGYVTKVVIPTSSVTKISKEKTAKIIPNAVGVATSDERHVFGSFISRESAFRLMCSVCPPLAPIELLPKAPADIEISEEYSIEDDSSCSISGNESPPQPQNANAAENDQTLLRRSAASSSLNLAETKRVSNEKQRHSDIPANAKNIVSSTSSQQHANVSLRASAPASTHYISNNNSKTTMSPVALASGSNIHVALVATPTTGAAASAATNLTMIIAGSASTTTSASSSPTPSSSSSPPTTIMATTPKSVAQAAANSFKTLSKHALLRLKFPTELNVVYLGVLLSLVLAFFSVFLLFRIINIEAKTSLYRSPVDFNWRSGNDDDIFAEALRWQKELQTKSTAEAQSILNTNLEQIAKVRRSLETLSMLINDRSSAYGTANRDDSD